jgi:hypothetical protein
MIAILIFAALAAPVQKDTRSGLSATSLRMVPPENRYIAESFALRDDAELAYVTTDADRNDTALHLVDLAAPDRKTTIPVSGRVEGLRWLEPGRVLVIARTGRGKQLIGRVFTAAGPGPGHIGPADHIGTAQLDGHPVITAHQQPAGRRGEHRVSAFDVVKLKPRASRTFRVDQRRQLTLGDQQVTLLWWEDDFTTAAIRHPGVYDEARDLRLPDRFGRVDLLTGKLLVDAAIEPAGFSRLVSIQGLYPGRSVLVHPDPRSGKLLLIDGAHWRELTPRHALAKYDLGRTRSQVLDARRVLLSLAVDPANPTATAQRRRDRDEVEFYIIDRGGGGMSPALVLEGRYRPMTWSASESKLAVLRKHRTFAAGGVALELYDLRPGPQG